MATKSIITGYSEVEHILPAEMLDAKKLTEAGGRLVEAFTIEVQRAKLETDNLVRIAVPADKIEEFGGHAVDYVEGAWVVNSVDKSQFEIRAEIEMPDEVAPLVEAVQDPAEVERIVAEEQAKAAQAEAQRSKVVAAVDSSKSGTTAAKLDAVSTVLDRVVAALIAKGIL